jgi:HlyD family secretion protein
LKKRIIIISFFSLIIIVSLFVYLGQRSKRLGELYYSGTIEATQAELSFQVNGRVVEVLVDEGHSVEKDQELAILDRSELLARRNQARGNLEAAEKDLQQSELNLEIAKENLPSEVARAEATVKALKARLDELESGYREQDVEKARHAMIAAEAALNVARKDKDRFDSLFNDTIVSEKERDAVDLQYEKSLRAYEQAKENFEQMSEGFRKENIESARANLTEGKTVLSQAKNNLKKIELYERAVEGAMARFQAAKAAFDLAETQLSFSVLTAPFKGIITSRSVEPGEVVTPAREVFSVADLSAVDVKIFVDETEIGKVKPGQAAVVTVDTFPDKVYRGKVAYISPEGEFTPKIIQTHKERVKLVYLVKLLIPNPDLELKSGMPADAWLRDEKFP